MHIFHNISCFNFKKNPKFKTRKKVVSKKIKWLENLISSNFVVHLFHSLTVFTCTERQKMWRQFHMALETPILIINYLWKSINILIWLKIYMINHMIEILQKDLFIFWFFFIFLSKNLYKSNKFWDFLVIHK